MGNKTLHLFNACDIFIIIPKQKLGHSVRIDEEFMSSLKPRPLCFVLMPFKEVPYAVYRDAIRPVCEAAGYECKRADDHKGPYNIHRIIIELLFKSDVIIADLSKWNPNVFYEMGVAHAIGNKTIMIIQEGQELPFDIKNYNCIFYENTPARLEKLKQDILECLEQRHEWQKHRTNPVQDYQPDNFLISQDEISTSQKRNKEQERIMAFMAPSLELVAIKEKLKNKEAELKTAQVTINRLQNEDVLQIVPKPAPMIVDLTNDMVLIPAGHFIMGNSEELIAKWFKKSKSWTREAFKAEIPAHPVWLDAYYISKHLVTNSQFAKFLDEMRTTKDDKGNLYLEPHEWGVQVINNRWQAQKGYENHPIINVTWYGANAYAQWCKCLLPTEAQWEKAARAGLHLEFATKDGTLSEYLANGMRKVGKTTKVGIYPANPYGMFDMTGNVFEWCYDWYGETYYIQSPERNPNGPDSGISKVARGGSWGSHDSWNMRCLNRRSFGPLAHNGLLGFRVMRPGLIVE
jgi:formylglycine-generating enzyme required for sulfatase activity